MLVVDDDVSIRTLFELALVHAGFEVAVVESGKAALTALEQRRFDAVVVDKNMPGMSGIELLRELRIRDPHVGCLVITAYASAQSARESMELGVDGYLRKPFDDMAVVIERIRAAAHTGAERRAHSQRQQASAQPGTQLRAVVAADSPEVAEALATVGGVKSVGSVDGLRSAIAEQSPHLVVLDAGLCGPSLLGFVRELRRESSQVAAVVLHDAADVDTLLAFIDAGVRCVLDKPVDTISLLSKVELMFPFARR